MTRKMMFGLLIVAFSCSDEESVNQQLSGTWIEQSPMANRTEVVFESNALMKVTLQNPERILSYTIMNFKEDSIELSDNLADMNNNVKFYLKIVDKKTITLESLYDNERTHMILKNKVE